ncbi:MAG: cobalt ECF transporter T component CbiQ [Clostridiaceae bacterium]|nr:cobalt ECF transporter T component CbiQ [Clostridiaceae bacterium]
MQIDYYAYHSGMKSWNAGFKASLAAAVLCAVLGMNQPGSSLFVILGMGLLTLAVGRVPFRIYLRYMLVPLLFLVVSCAAIAVDFSGSRSGDWNQPVLFFYLCVTKKSLLTAGKVFLKVLAGVSTLYMLSFSTPVSELILVLQKLHLPRFLLELMHLIYRYIFILFEAVLQMQTAAKARLGYHGFRRSCRTFSMIGGNLFVLSMKKANSYYDAMLARGYQGRLEFLAEEKPVKLWQLLAGSLYMAGVVLAGWLTL